MDQKVPIDPGLPDPQKVDSDEPLVSVILLIYTRDLTGLASVIEQDYKGPLEIIAVHTTEEPLETIKLDPCLRERRRLVWFQAPSSVSYVELKNFALAKATGKYLSFLSQDETWVPSKIRLQIAEMQECGAEMSCGELLLPDQKWCLRDLLKRSPERSLTPQDLLDRMGKLLFNSTLVLTHELYNRTGGLTMALTRTSVYQDEEGDWQLRLAIQTYERGCCILFLNRPLARGGSNYLLV